MLVDHVHALGQKRHAAFVAFRLGILFSLRPDHVLPALRQRPRCRCLCGLFLGGFDHRRGVAQGVELLRREVHDRALHPHFRVALGRLTHEHAIEDFAGAAIAEFDRSTRLVFGEGGRDLGRGGRGRRHDGLGGLRHGAKGGVRRCRAGGRREENPRRGNCPSLAAVEAGILGR